MLIGPFTIANGAALSDTVAMSRIERNIAKNMAPVALLCPAEVTSASLQIEHSYDGAVWYVVSPLATAEAVSIGDDDANLVRKSIPLDPARYLGIGHQLRLRTSGNEGQESVFYLVYEAVA